MMLFVGHDPGAKNHIRPIYNHAVRLGQPAKFIDLACRNELMEDKLASMLVDSLVPDLLVCGCSINKGEWPFVRACKQAGVGTIMIVDIGASGKLELVPTTDFPDCFMVTNLGCRDELVGYGANPDTTVITGSPHLEALTQNTPHSNVADIHQYYGISPGDSLVSFFCTPDIDDSVGAVSSLATSLPTTGLESPIIIVRPHPRSPSPEPLEHACSQFDCVRLDSSTHISTPALLLASCMSFSMTSTVSLESLAIGIPSAFYQIGWAYHQADQRYRNINSILRIRDITELGSFVNGVLDQQGLFVLADIEDHQGALGSIWGVISKMNPRR